MSLTREEKERFLKALEEDREFRYAVMGLLGYGEVLERITRIEERQQRLEERFARLEERFARLEERQQKLEERQQKLEEHFARLEERQQRLEERQQRLEERQQRLEERQQKLEERMLRVEERLARLEEEVRNNRRIVLAVAHRFGVISESAFRDAMRYVVEEALGAGRVSRWTHYDSEGVVYGHPALVEVDVLVRNGVHVLVEVKSRAGAGDVLELRRIGELYERVEGVKPRLVIIAGLIDEKARELAGKLGVEIKPVAPD
ncbi:PD-(D/E)XK nuclease family protein [Stetteria hydrogenophila]